MIIGISGPSGSGKTTIARAIRQAYSAVSSHTVQILHQDDFYRPERDIPKIPTRVGDVVNWDCPEAIETDPLIRMLQTYRKHGQFPDDVKEDLAHRAKEDQNDTSATEVSSSIITHLQKTSKIVDLQQDLLIVDGFMLYHDQEMLSNFDVPILLRGSYKALKERREQRSGYVTLEGFWRDPEGYFEDCVWPEYVKSHERFFVNGDVEGEIKADTGLVMTEQLDSSLDDSFRFVVDQISHQLQG